MGKSPEKAYQAFMEAAIIDQFAVLNKRGGHFFYRDGWKKDMSWRYKESVSEEENISRNIAFWNRASKLSKDDLEEGLRNTQGSKDPDLYGLLAAVDHNFIGRASMLSSIKEKLGKKALIASDRRIVLSQYMVLGAICSLYKRDDSLAATQVVNFPYLFFYDLNPKIRPGRKTGEPTIGSKIIGKYDIAKDARITGLDYLFLKNAISNADRFADSVTVTVGYQEEKDLIVVEDNGPGMNRKSLERFLSDARFTTRHKADTEGGLGSLLYRRIADVQDAELIVESQGVKVRYQDGNVEVSESDVSQGMKISKLKVEEW